MINPPRPVARRLFDWAVGGKQASSAMIVDYGISSLRHEELLQRAVVQMRTAIGSDEATLLFLDAILGDGPGITRFVTLWSPEEEGRIRYVTGYDDEEDPEE